MRSYRVRYTPDAARLIGTLPLEVKRVLRSAIDELRRGPEEGGELVGEFLGYRSLRVRRYRVIYRMHDEDASVDIYPVGLRRDVYETLRTLLSGSA